MTSSEAGEGEANERGSFSNDPAYAVRPYRPDGGCRPADEVKLLLAMAAAGGLLGWGASQFVPLVWIVGAYAMGVGLFAGAIGAALVRPLRVRSPGACLRAGLIAGCAAMAVMRYFDYRQHMWKVDASIRHAHGDKADTILKVVRNFDAYRAMGDQAPESIRKLMDEFEQDPEFLFFAQIDTLPEVLTAMADAGLLVSRVGHTFPTRQLALAGPLAYGYWIAEILIVAGLTYWFMRPAAREPFSTGSMSWKTLRTFGPYDRGDAVAQAIGEGRLSSFARSRGAGGTTATVRLYVSPNEPDAPVDAEVVRHVASRRGERRSVVGPRVTYPAGSLPGLLEALEASSTERTV